MNTRFLLLAALFAASGCATGPALTNSTSSPIKKNDRAIGTMEFTFESNGDAHSNVLRGTSSTGETFTGNLLQQNHTEPYPKALVIWENIASAGLINMAGKQPDKTVYNSSWSGNLVGSKGTILACDFNVYKTNGSPVDNGEGNCQGSDGTLIPIAIVNPPVAVK